MYTYEQINTQTSNSWWFQEMTLALPSSRSTLKARISASRASRSSSLVFRFQMRLDCAWSSWNLWTTMRIAGIKGLQENRCYKRHGRKPKQTCGRKAPSWLQSLFVAVSSSGWLAFGLDSEKNKSANSDYQCLSFVKTEEKWCEEPSTQTVTPVGRL